MAWWEEETKVGVDVEVASPAPTLVAWPTPQDYNEAVQSAANFSDKELCGGEVVTNALGLPRVITGAFASVYKFQCGKRDWAVRCFLRNFADQEERYARICEFISHDNLPYTVGFEYLAQGLLLHGRRYPIMKMEWLNGQTMNEFIDSHHNDRHAMNTLLERFHEMVAALAGDGIAHGDLQHANILVLSNGQLRLVDYDGMFVPSLKGMTSNELGHPNYQHPARHARYFGPQLDYFAAWLIHTSLVAIREDPKLWRKLNGGDDCLLFRRADLQSPLDSGMFALLENHENAEVRQNVRHLRALVMGDLEALPPLQKQPPQDLPELAPTSRTARQAAQQLKHGVAPTPTPPKQKTNRKYEAPVLLQQEPPPMPDAWKTKEPFWQPQQILGMLGFVVFMLMFQSAKVSVQKGSNDSSYQAHYDLAQEHLKHGSYAAAIGESDAAIRSTYDKVDQAHAYRLRGTANKKLGNQAQRLQDMRNAMGNEPEDALNSYEVATALIANDQPVLAQAVADDFVASHIGDPYGYANRAGVEVDLKEYTKAIEDAERALSLKSPPVATAYYNLAQAYNGLDRHNEALTAFEKYITIEPKDPDGYFGRGYTFGCLGQYENSMINFNRCVEMEPTNGDCWADMAWTANQMKDYDAAAKYAKKAIQLQESDASPYYELAYAQYKTKLTAVALQSINQNLKLAPNNLDGYELREDIYRSMGRNADAARDAYTIAKLKAKP